MSKASDSVLEQSPALRLDDAERAHLFDLAPAASPGAGDEGDVTRVRPVLRQLLDAFTGAAAFVGNDRLEILGANGLGYALFSPMFAAGAQTTSLARFTFLDPGAREFFCDWAGAASDVAAALRSAVGRNPADRELAGLVSELAAGSAAFRARWAAHNVKLHHSGVKTIKHPLAGELELNYEQLMLPSDPRLAIFTLGARPGTPAAESFSFLASWSSAHPNGAAVA
jgi:hypothetical protein